MTLNGPSVEDVRFLSLYYTSHNVNNYECLFSLNFPKVLFLFFILFQQCVSIDLTTIREKMLTNKYGIHLQKTGHIIITQTNAH